MLEVVRICDNDTFSCGNMASTLRILIRSSYLLLWFVLVYSVPAEMICEFLQSHGMVMLSCRSCSNKTKGKAFYICFKNSDIACLMAASFSSRYSREDSGHLCCRGGASISMTCLRWLLSMEKCLQILVISK